MHSCVFHIGDSVSSATILPIHAPHQPSSSKVSTMSPRPAPPSVFQYSCFLSSLIISVLSRTSLIRLASIFPASEVPAFFFSPALRSAPSSVNPRTWADEIQQWLQSSLNQVTPEHLSKTWLSNFENCSCSGPYCLVLVQAAARPPLRVLLGLLFPSAVALELLYNQIFLQSRQIGVFPVHQGTAKRAVICGASQTLLCC